ncbi:MAG: hypothetical protein KGS72_10720 [Cyanobacteria bacterium REEB67]|nr:hypothetical protein [Cyanobacteria bacterium REEB67]
MHFSFGDESEFEQYILGFKPAKHLKESLWKHTLGHLKQFNLEHPTDAYCVESIYRRMESVSPFTCSYCGSQEFRREFGARKGRCAKCNKPKNFTAQSEFFNGMKAPRAYCGMLYLLEKGCFFNAHQVASELKISRGSSWELQREIDMAIDHAITLGEVSNLDSALFRDLYMRRSSVTPAYEDACSEQEAMEKLANQNVGADAAGTSSQADFDPLTNSYHFSDFEPYSDSFESNSPAENVLPLTPSRSDGADHSEIAPDHLTELQKKLYAAIGPEPVSFDTLFEIMNVDLSELLSALTMLELDELIVGLAGQKFQRQKATPGNALVVSKASSDVSSRLHPPGLNPYISSAESEQLDALAISFRAFIRVLSQGISRKYIQLYFARFCFLLLSKNETNPFSLFGACFEFGEVSRIQVKIFVSALKIKFASAIFCV